MVARILSDAVLAELFILLSIQSAESILLFGILLLHGRVGICTNNEACLWLYHPYLSRWYFAVLVRSVSEAVLHYRVAYINTDHAFDVRGFALDRRVHAAGAGVTIEMHRRYMSVMQNALHAFVHMHNACMFWRGKGHARMRVEFVRILFAAAAWKVSAGSDVVVIASQPRVLEKLFGGASLFWNPFKHPPSECDEISLFASLHATDRRFESETLRNSLWLEHGVW